MRQLTASFCLILLVFLGGVGKSFALPTCQGNDESKWRNCEGTLASATGKVFLGEFKDGKFVGVHAETGNKYEGEFNNGKFHGQSTYTWADGNKYVGREWLYRFDSGPVHQT